MPLLYMRYVQKELSHFNFSYNLEKVQQAADQDFACYMIKKINVCIFTFETIIRKILPEYNLQKLHYNLKNENCLFIWSFFK